MWATYEKKCVICGKNFTTTVSWAETCGEVCRRKKVLQERKEKALTKEQERLKAIPAGTEHMVKTSEAVCRQCRYSIYFSAGLCVCDYLAKTGKRRNCPVGYCDKQVKKRRRRK